MPSNSQIGYHCPVGASKRENCASLSNIQSKTCCGIGKCNAINHTDTVNAEFAINSSVFAPDTEVYIYHLRVAGPPIVEGRARVIGRHTVNGLPDLWRVRFLGEDITRLRLVHGGDWQSRPDAVLRALTQEWRLSFQPELLFESPFPERL